MFKQTFLLFFFMIAMSANSNVIETKYSNFLLPKILSDNDLEIYTNASEYQKKHDWEKANRELSKVENNILVGHFIYEQLMHPNKYKSSYEELSNWFRTYEDYPPVLRKRVYNLLIKRIPDREKKKLYQRPLFDNYLRGYGEDNYGKKTRSVAKNIDKVGIKNKIELFIDKGDNEKVIEIINKYKHNDYILFLLNKKISKIFFKGDIIKSKNLYDFYIKELNIQNPNFLFRAGINSYRLKDFEKAKTYFDKCNYFIKNANRWLYSGCHYWGSLLVKSRKNKNSLLEKAASYPRTLYGQLAIEKLKIADPFVWESKLFKSNPNFSSLNQNKTFRRAIALQEMRFYNYADLEIRNLYSKINKEKLDSLFYASEKLDLPAVLMRLGSKYYKKDITLYMRGLYPTPDWDINNGYQLDKALLFALIRRESAFNLKAKSEKGARGLMQIMPRTASKLENNYRLRYSEAHKLYSLQLNLEIGQKFLKKLMRNSESGNSILDVLISYNAGIKRLKNWKKYIVENDPIVFIESIPIKETRWFVKYILTDLWIYRDRMEQEKPSRTLLANGKWPIYENLDYKLIQDAKFKK